MIRRIAIVSTLLAMMMVLFTSFVPHHHHQAMICLVHEVCLADGCVDDEHTSHSDTDPKEEEGHCVSHAKYFPSDELRLDTVPLPPAFIEAPLPFVAAVFRLQQACPASVPSNSPPLLTWRINC